MIIMAKNVIEFRFTGGINNLNTPLDLFLRKRGEAQEMVNADLSYLGQVRRLLPLTALNASAGTSLHSLFVANGVVFVMDGDTLNYLDGDTLTPLITGLAGDKVSYEKVGNWLFLADGTYKKSVYIPDKTECDWGCAIPTAAPTVADSGSGGNPDGTYQCYYRHKITLPDGTIIRTALSPSAEVTVATNKISWSDLVHSTFTGATTIEVELFRTKTGFAATYLVATVASGTTTYDDDISDEDLQASTEYDEEGNYPPPDNPTLLKYYPASDRLFCVVGGDAYWSEAGQYHIFSYASDGSDYENVNSVFLAGEDISAIKIIDENMYFASPGTWRRLRGKSPSDWSWEDTSAITGAINHWSAVDTPFGILGPSIDGRLYLFNGFSSRPFLEEFIFLTLPTATVAHGAYDGRFYHLFYDDATNPELVVDLAKYPGQTPRITQSTRKATDCFYNRHAGQFYYCDTEYVRMGADASASVAVSLRTAEIPPEDTSVLGNMGMLIVKANTQGDDMTITPYFDGVAQTALTAITTTALQYKEVPMRFGDMRALSFAVDITSDAAIIIEEPWMLRKD